MEFGWSRYQGRDFNYTKGDLVTDVALGAVLGATSTGGIALTLTTIGAIKTGMVFTRGLFKKYAVETVSRIVKSLVVEPKVKEISDTMNETLIGEEHLDYVEDAFNQRMNDIGNAFNQGFNEIDNTINQCINNGIEDNIRNSINQ